MIESVQPPMPQVEKSSERKPALARKKSDK